MATRLSRPPSLGLIAAACAALAGLSLLAPSSPTYDPWAWLVWGREVAALDLSTVGGPVWKPLPVIATTLLSLAGGAAPLLWIGIARIGALLAVAIAARLAWRLGGAAAAPVAAAGLLVSEHYVLHAGWGNSEGWLVALVLLAVDRQLAGRGRQAFVCGALAALIRPELVVLVWLHAILLWRRDPGARGLAAAVALALPALWTLPELWGSGDLMRGSGRSRQVDPGSFGAQDLPWLAVLRSAVGHVPWPLWVGVLALPAMALARRGEARAASEGSDPPSPRIGEERALRVAMAIAAGGLGWVAIVAAMAVAGFSGAPRFLLLTAGLEAVAGAVGLVAGARRLAGAGARGRRVAAAVAVTLALVAFAAQGAPGISDDARVLADEARVHDGLAAAVAGAGGAQELSGCRPAATERLRRPVTAWHLRSPLADIAPDDLPPDAGLVLRYADTPPGAWRITGAGSCQGLAARR